MRLAVLSNQRLNPWINWTTLGPPLLQPLACHPDAALIVPPPVRWSSARLWPRLVRKMWRYDTLFWMQGSARPELSVLLASGSRGIVRRSTFVVDAWRPALTKIGTLAVAQQLNPCFVAFREGWEELSHRYPQGRFEWLPFGIDTDVFDATPGDRDIFAFWMGRRYEPLHQALLRYCEQRGLIYRYSQKPGEFLDPADLGRVAGRSRYFLVTPPDLNDPVRTGGFSPLVMRYMEGLSAGARLLGVLPKSGEYEDLLPREAILEVAPDGSDLAERLDADMYNREGWEAVEQARFLVREHHSWRRRAEQIYTRLATGKGIDVQAARIKHARAALSSHAVSLGPHVF
jgi:hypothetical protein